MGELSTASDDRERDRRRRRSRPAAGGWRPRRRGRARIANALHAAKQLLIGQPRATSQLRRTELPKLLALPVFSADPLSSVAYATEQAMIVLFAVSISGRDLILPLAGAVAALLAIVVLSYRQTVRAYTTSGGAYAVARENLGTTAGLAAAAALLIDYVLTVAVSVSAGVTAITSAYGSLSALAVPMAVGAIGLLTLVNLRGVRETGIAFAAPTYAFVGLVLLTIVAGIVQCTGGCPSGVVPDPEPVGPAGATIGIFVVLHAFASGSTALTGIEAISNGVSAFRRPKGVNAAKTLGAMGVIALALFGGVSFLAVQVKAAPSGSVSVLSEIARAVFPTGALFPGGLFYAVQLLTFAILILAANSAFQGFPRLASLLARDRFLPRAFGDLGDRLVYSNGALVLAALATALVIAFAADVERLIQLYVVGVFCAFTLSQLGMVRHWRRTHGREQPGVAASDQPSWRRGLAINAVGAGATGAVTAVVIATKLLHGAWVVIVAMPLIVVGLRHVHDRFRAIDGKLRRGAVKPRDKPVHNSVVLYVEGLDAASHEALAYIHHIDEDAVHAVHVAGHGSARDVAAEWSRLGDPHRLTILEADGRDPVATVIDHVDALERPDGEHFVTVVIPELMRKPSLAQLRHRHALELKLRLLAEPGVVVTDVPVLDETGAEPLAAESIEPDESAAFVIVQAVDDAAVNAVNYARALHSFPTRALHFALHPEATEEIQRQWERRGLPIALEIVDCPFREIADPLLDTLRPITRQAHGIAAVILPEPIVGGRFRSILRNRASLYLQWLLLFEPHVVLCSVPYGID